MKSHWKLQDAKAKFSRVVEEALNVGPQYVSRRGVDSVVILPVEEYEKLLSGKPTFKEFLLKSPKIEGGLEVKRQKDIPGRIEL